ncbi:hypothetical protein Ga0466249_004564 [Sporomusaceae bacterium BoRhaA]|uniref:hypothetical protein n=1 Tax=Pelorhabdus rhamnosifermentans TaxID=2772457 RepID=UPI001C05FE11|nr:hypothetical protein [Pelorhabdus rhamnosifermentans]MBU2703419.1 hypothetical protein [Pelorhabdus rhamnosifermentans]
MKKVKSSKKLCIVRSILGTVVAVSLFYPAVNAEVTVMAASPTVIEQQLQVPAIQSSNWEPEVKTTVNNFLKMYGKYSPTYNQNNPPYATFDFDNTTSIMDVEEQLIIWQLDHLAFAIPPEKMEEVLKTGIPAEKLTMTYGANNGDGRPATIQAAINDAVNDYKVLYEQGVVTTTGSEQTDAVKGSFAYQDFTAKMRWLYDAISETMDNSVSYPWVTYWYTGMTPQQVFDLAYTCDSYYGDSSKGQTWTKGKYTSPDTEASQAGSVTVSYNQGITVTPEVRELYQALAEDGIDPWIVSASHVDVVRAAVKYFAIPDVKGVVGMTNKLDDQGKYINIYDYDAHAQTQGVGKSLSIEKVIAPQYQGQGPIFCAMDSQGDFNFCTEFANTKAVLIMNRRRKDDAALCAAIAEYQKEHHITLQQANDNGDVRYVLQGRNETVGLLWPDNQTIFLGKTDKVFLSDRAKQAIAELDSGMSIAQLLKKDTSLKDYQGYKTR